MNNNYVVYHLHDDQGSILDSCTKWNDYVDLAKSYGMTAIASTNHGYNLNWTEKKQYCKSQGIKYIFGVEAYLTEKLIHNKTNKNGEIEQYKERDNYHTILLAKNQDGADEINAITSPSTDIQHKYYKPRISFDEFLSLSNNVITTSACIQSPLRKYNYTVDGFNQELLEKLLQKYDYYEIQYHNNSEQIEYNKWLYEMAKKYNKPLIAATDTHSLNSYKAECRKILMISKGIEFTNEEECDLTFKSYDELVNMFDIQDALPQKIWMQAIENTNDLAEQIEDYDLNTESKYPILYGSPEKDANTFINKTKTMYQDKIKKGIIPENEIKEYNKDIPEELAVFKKTNMLGFMLSMSELMCWCKSNNIPIGPSRGSVAGSRTAFITDIIDVDPVKWHTVFSRFCNEDRVEIGDIDVDVPDEYREQIYHHIFDSFGTEKCAYVLALTTVSDKGTIDDIGRALSTIWQRNNPDRKEADNPYSLQKVAKIKDEYSIDPEKCKEKYKELFYYFDGLNGTSVALSHHPAGVVICPENLQKKYGVFYDKDGLQILNLDMDAAHEVGLAKYDILGLDTVSIIDKTCKYANVKYPHTYEMNFADNAVWDSMKKSSVALFQFTKPFAFDCLKKYDVKSIEDVTAITAAIRPSGASYRDKLIAHQRNHNPSKQIDDLLAKNNGWLIYQEDVIAFLQQVCGLSGSKADTIRRAIGHKDVAVIEKELPNILKGYCDNSSKPIEIAEQEAKTFLKIIEDSSSYMFGYNHAIGYSILTYYCAYYRHYYPIEFATAVLNTADTEEKIVNGINLAKQCNIKIKSIKFRHSREYYYMDKTDNSIYKGIASIKYCNAQMGKELYDIKDMQFDSFVDLLVYLTENLNINSRQLETLIYLGFFSEFGGNKKLLSIFMVFQKSKIQYKKTYCDKTKVKRIEQLKEFEQKVPNKSLSPKLQIEYENEVLGSPESVFDLGKGVGYVMDINTKYSPIVKLYGSSNGVIMNAKINTKYYNSNPVHKGDFIKITNYQCKPRCYKTEDGWKYDNSEKVFWLTGYEIMYY